MKKYFAIGLTFLAAVALVALTVAGPVTGQITKGKERPLMTKQLMGGLVGPNCSALAKGLKAGPADDKAWAALATNTALLNEASYILMADDRCPDGVWAGAATKALRVGSADLLEKIADHDLDGANAAFIAMTGACGTCHTKHRKNKS